MAVAPPIANTRAGFDVTRVAPPSGEAERAVTCSAGSDATSAQRASSPTRKTFPLLPVPTRIPSGVRTAAWGTSSGELQRVSTSPEGRIRRRAPLGGPDDASVPVAAGAEGVTIEKLSLTVTSATTPPVAGVAAGAAAGAAGRAVSAVCPSIAAAYRLPSGPRSRALISRKAESTRTKAFPGASMR